MFKKMLLLMIVALLSMSVSSLSISYAQDLSADLVAHYKFDGNLNDETGNYNAVDTVSAPGATPQYVEGYDGTPNGALNFPGTEDGWYRIDCGRFSPSQLGVAGELTVAFWANWNGVPDHNYQDIIDKRDEWSDDGMVFSIGQHSRWDWNLGLWRGGTGDREAGSIDSIRVGYWDFFTITMDANTSIATFYKNGESYDTGLYTPAVGYNAMVMMGTSPSGQNNSYNGKLDEVGFYSRVLTDQEVSDLYKSYVTTDVKQIDKGIPSGFELSQNYPNPFNPTTLIQYTLGENTKVEIAVYDLLGQKVATLVNGYQKAGSHQVVWDASKASAGVYLYQMKTKDLVESKKMLLVK